MSPRSKRETDGLPDVAVPGLYVHVPFCFHKCHYCDFYSITRQEPQRMERFVDLILREADGWAGGDRGPTVVPKTIFIGGGTPSLLPQAAMERLLRGLRQRFDFSQLTEWTVECNPATVSIDYCAMLRACGVDRLSFGAQSFAAGELAVLERHHAVEDVFKTVQIARAARFRRLNVDLIYAIPGQSMESWRRSLAAAVALDTEHVSAYNLTYEPNTPIAVKKRLGTITPVDEDTELEMLHVARRTLAEAGFAAYEISNYARPGEECRHNLLYWNGGSYIGLGPSAASHVDGHRWKNRPHLGEWESAIEADTLPTTDVEHLTPRQRAGELVMLQLRLAKGVRFQDIQTATGLRAQDAYNAVLKMLITSGLIEMNQEGFALSERGINVADAVAAEFLETEPTAAAERLTRGGQL
jgi:oxygen-independent coproporphyrinogen III oxidase